MEKISNIQAAVPSTEYLEMSYVGETATGRGHNQRIEMENLHDGTFRTTESRVGITIGRHRPRHFVSPMERWDDTYVRYRKRGYIVTKTCKMDKVEITYGGQQVEGKNYKDIPDPSVNEIVLKILEYANKTISENYTVSMDNISDEMIDLGKKILDSLALNYQSMSIAEVNNKLKVLYAAIPRRIDNLSKHLAKRHLDVLDIIGSEQELYDIMVKRIRSEKVMKADRTILEAFGLDWRPVTEAERDMLCQKLQESASRYHTQRSTVNWKTEQKFRAFCEKEGLTEESGISHLFHGSRSENFWSILTYGLTINPTNVVINGKMFGNGTYFAPLARKSLGYTSSRSSYWVRGSSDLGYLALYKVATGKRYDVETSQSDLTWDRLQIRCPGAHCTWAHAGSSLRNDEVIVYQDDKVQ